MRAVSWVTDGTWLYQDHHWRRTRDSKFSASSDGNAHQCCRNIFSSSCAEGSSAEKPSQFWQLRTVTITSYTFFLIRPLQLFAVQNSQSTNFSRARKRFARIFWRRVISSFWLHIRNTFEASRISSSAEVAGASENARTSVLPEILSGELLMRKLEWNWIWVVEASGTLIFWSATSDIRVLPYWTPNQSGFWRWRRWDNITGKRTILTSNANSAYNTKWENISSSPDKLWMASGRNGRRPKSLYFFWMNHLVLGSSSRHSSSVCPPWVVRVRLILRFWHRKNTFTCWSEFLVKPSQKSEFDCIHKLIRLNPTDGG